MAELEKINDADFGLLCEQVVEGMERFRVPGVAVGIVHGGEEHAAGFGVTSVENPLPVNADTLFQIGSTTKTVTGTVVMRLVEEGKLDLDEPVRSYLPEMRLSDEAVAGRVTLRHLLTHTGGWLGDFFDDTGAGDDALARIVERFGDLPQLTPLGKVWSYNNSGFYLAGRVIEMVTGKQYEQVVREMVFEPLGMNMSFYFPAEIMTYRFVVGHTVPYEEGEGETTVERDWPVPRAAGPAGGIISTVRDQLTYARFHMGDGSTPDGKKLLSQESIRLMQTPLVSAAEKQQFGLTWFVVDVQGERIVRHGGVTNGQISAFMMAPERQFAITVLTNANMGAMLNRDVTRWAFKHYLGVSIEDPEVFDTPAEDIRQYVGRYSSAHADVNLTLRDSRLVLELTPRGGFPRPDSPPPPTPPSRRVGLCDEDYFLILDEPGKGSKGEFLRDEAGRIEWLRLGGRVMRREE